MKIRSTAKSAFERQVTESVIIQQESMKHNILNSKSEYNRCALPRITTKLGEKEFNSWKEEQLLEKQKEEEIEKKIRILRKERNKDRRQVFPERNQPAMKKRKLGTNKFKTVKQMLKDWKPVEREEKREDEQETVEEKKQKVESKEDDGKDDEDNPHGEEEKENELEVKKNWDEEIRKHKLEIEEEIREKENIDKKGIR